MDNTKKFLFVALLVTVTCSHMLPSQWLLYVTCGHLRVSGDALPTGVTSGLRCHLRHVGKLDSEREKSTPNEVRIVRGVQN